MILQISPKYTIIRKYVQVKDRQVGYKFVYFQTVCQYHFILLCFKFKPKNMKTFILIVACIGLSSAFELSELLSGRLVKSPISSGKN